MDRKETVGILGILRTAYPQSFRNMPIEDQERTLDLYATIFKNVPYEDVAQAVYTIISTEDREFAPNIAHINRMVAKRAVGGQSADEAWEEVRRTLRNLDSDMPSEAEGHWKTLPRAVRAIYTPADLVDMAFRRTSADLSAYERPRFAKAYSEITESHLSMTAYAIASGEKTVGEISTGGAKLIEGRKHE